MWCLARKLPLMVGTHIPEKKPHWDNFLLMLTITDYVFGPVISHEIIPYIKALIQEHHEAFCILYPNASIIPKMHYIIHLPEWISKYVYTYNNNSNHA